MPVCGSRCNKCSMRARARASYFTVNYQLMDYTSPTSIRRDELSVLAFQRRAIP